MKKNIEKIGNLEINWNASLEDLNKKRAEIREVMNQVYNEYLIYRRAIEKIDALNDIDFRQKYINKCFIRYDSDTIHVYYKVTGFRDANIPQGIGITIIDDTPYAIGFEKTIWEDNLQRSMEINDNVFNEILNIAIDALKKQHIIKEPESSKGF